MFQPAASPRPPLSRRFGPAGAELSHRAPTASYAACVSLASRISLKVNDAPAPHPMDSSMLTARGRERKRSWVRHCPYSNINYLSVVETTFSAHCAMILILYVFKTLTSSPLRTVLEFLAVHLERALGGHGVADGSDGLEELLFLQIPGNDNFALLVAAPVRHERGLAA